MLEGNRIALDQAAYYLSALEDVVSTKDVSPIVIDAMKANNFELASLLVDLSADLGEPSLQIAASFSDSSSVLETIVWHPSFDPVLYLLPDFVSFSIHRNEPRPPAYAMAESVLSAFMSLHPTENNLEGDDYWQREVDRLIHFIRNRHFG